MFGRLQNAIKKGKTALGTFVFSSDPAVVEVIGFSGFDFVIIDTEHGQSSPFDTNHLGNMIRAAEVSGMSPIVRVTEKNRAMILKVMDAGAAGVIVPHIKTVDDANDIVTYSRFRPEGLRGSCPYMKAKKWFMEGWEEYREKSNKDFYVIPLIEDKEAIDNIEEIIAIEGISFPHYGPFDLAQSYGMHSPEAVYTEKIVKAREKIIKACKKHNKPFMDIAFNAEHAKQLFKENVDFVSYGTDLMVLGDWCKNLVQSVKNQ